MIDLSGFERISGFFLQAKNKKASRQIKENKNRYDFFMTVRVKVGRNQCYTKQY
jgi:hypothetical protein